MVLVGWDCIVKILKLYLKISSFVNIISNVNVIANNGPDLDMIITL